MTSKTYLYICKSVIVAFKKEKALLAKGLLLYAPLSLRLALHLPDRVGKYDKGGRVLSFPASLAYIWAWKRLQAYMHCNGHGSYRSCPMDALPLPSILTHGQRARHLPHWSPGQDASTGHSYHRNDFKWIAITCSCLPMQTAILNHATAYLSGTWGFHRMDLNYIR